MSSPMMMLPSRDGDVGRIHRGAMGEDVTVIG
jgi:hypothetical protein